MKAPGSRIVNELMHLNLSRAFDFEQSSVCVYAYTVHFRLHAICVARIGLKPRLELITLL
jgi:hypothetical protein